MTGTQAGDGTRPLRADARINRDRILAAACDVFVELGPGAPLEEISRRAGTGIATLYRRFPDRRELMRVVVIDALRRTTEEARQAAAEEPDPFSALTRYMHRALDIRVAAVIPALLQEIALDDEEMIRAREESVPIIQGMIDAAKQAGTLHPNVTFADVGLLIVRLARPLPGPFPQDLNGQLAHRHLDLLINGLRSGADHTAQIEGPELTYRELRAVAERLTPASSHAANAQRTRP